MAIIEIDYILTTNGKSYFKGSDDDFITVNNIKELSLGRYQIECYDITEEGKEGETNSIITLYPSVIKEVKSIIK